jgi:pimeloyl-ACP methyl ester carboxylesterase
MTTFAANDGTQLAYHTTGKGSPLVCLPGGPMQDSAYLGDLGGLSEHRRLILLDPRGTGESATPTDTTSYRCDRQVDDVEALRVHLGLDQMDLLANSAGANLAILYAARYPERVSKLALIAPSVFAVGITITTEARMEVARLRQDEPWFDGAITAFQAIVAGTATDDDWAAVRPFSHGRWDAATQAYAAEQDSHRNQEAAAVFSSEGAYDLDGTRTALGALMAPVLLLAGEVDLGTIPSAAAEYADLFGNAGLVVQPGAGHFPWRDDPERFVATVSTFLG